MRRHHIIVLLSVIGGLILALVGPWNGAASVALSANPNVGYVDFAFGSAPGIDATADKPQSKLWFNDGFWWAVMFHTASNTWHIYKLNWPNQWADTGTVVDNRPTSRADCLWDGAHLYIAALVRFSSSNQGRLYRYSYNANADIYTLDSGFPVQIMTGSAETMAFDKDSTGQLWISYTQSNKVYVNRSTTDDATWGTPFVIPGPTSATNVYPDDISSLVAYRDADGSSIGVLWSNHDPSHPAPTSMYFSHHKDADPDMTWQPIEPIYTAMCAADDHINLKSLQSDPSGAIFAAVKTSFGDSGCGNVNTDPLLRLIVRKPNNSWAWTTFGTIRDDMTRPLVQLDTTNRKVYMFATSPTSCGIIYMKSTSMDNPDFSNQPGKGTPFISSSTYTCLNNATSTKQTVDAVSDLVVLAGDENQRVYMHNTLDLGTPAPRLSFSVNPGNSQFGTPLAPQPVVTALDSQGQPATNFNGPITLAIKSGTGTSGAALSGTVTVNAVGGVASFNGLSITKAGAGYQLTAAANGFASAASTAFDIARADQTITFSPLPSKRYLDPPFTVSATASSGLPVNLSDPIPADACTVSGSTITITAAGSCTVQASQPGDGNYNPAPDVLHTFAIAKADQTIAFELPPNERYGDPPFRINAVASSNLRVSFSASGACTVTDDNLVTLTGPDDCRIRATQAGNDDYSPAPEATRTITYLRRIYMPLLTR